MWSVKRKSRRHEVDRVNEHVMPLRHRDMGSQLSQVPWRRAETWGISAEAGKVASERRSFGCLVHETKRRDHGPLEGDCGCVSSCGTAWRGCDTDIDESGGNFRRIKAAGGLASRLAESSLRSLFTRFNSAKHFDLKLFKSGTPKVLKLLTDDLRTRL